MCAADATSPATRAVTRELKTCEKLIKVNIEKGREYFCVNTLCEEFWGKFITIVAPGYKVHGFGQRELIDHLARLTSSEGYIFL